jgi:DNA-binding NarL/FixJ family response regulator
MGNTSPVVIIIDDDQAVRDYARFILELEGMIVFEATDGNQGLAKASEHQPSLIITDLVMPDKEGIETIREIKERFPGCGIVAISGALNSQSYLSLASCLGAHCVVRKPFDRRQFLDAVRKALALRDGASGAV